VGSALLGVKIQPIQDQYTTINRTAKYMMLIIMLTFLVVFLTEVIQKIKVHVFQYALIGLALVIFFSLLLSFSEVIGYKLAYMVAVTATIGLIFLYSLTIYQDSKSARVLLILLCLIFSFVYTIIQMEESSLLVGSLGLFVILAATMYATRRINWYENNDKSSSEILPPENTM
jgi:inner membrane protein